jgi:ornithine carbamoyltransferase
MSNLRVHAFPEVTDEVFRRAASTAFDRAGTRMPTITAVLVARLGS